MREVNLHISRKSDTLVLSVDNTPQANLRIDTHSGDGCLVNWDDGNVEVLPSGSTVTHVYATNFTGNVLVTPLGGYSDISRFQSTGSTAWDFDLGVFTPLTGLFFFSLNILPNANITGSLNSFTGATELISFQLSNTPNANIDGSINSFSGATGLTIFRLYNLPNAIITGDSSAFVNKTNINSLLMYNNSTTSNITINYDDILNIWGSSVNISTSNSGISASKATTAPFSFDSLSLVASNFQGIGLSTASMDNMIIALDNSLIVQSSAKTIRLDQNAPHSGSPAVTAAISSLTSKNITLVL